MAEKTWEESVQYAKSRSILDVAADLNMELYRQGKEYRWKEHDSLVITPLIICGIGFRKKMLVVTLLN